MFMTSLTVTYQMDATGELAAPADTNNATFPLSMASFLNSSANIARLKTKLWQKIHGIKWEGLTRQRILFAPCSPHALFQRTGALQTLHQLWITRFPSCRDAEGSSLLQGLPFLHVCSVSVQCLRAWHDGSRKWWVWLFALCRFCLCCEGASAGWINCVPEQV